MSSPLVKKLIESPICKGLSEAEAAEIFSVAQETSLQRGATLFQEGDPGDTLFVVLEGALDITKLDRDGNQQLLAKVERGGVLGEMSLVDGTGLRSASAVASSDVQLLKVSAAKFSQLLKEDRLSALKMVHNLAQVMSRRLLMMNEKLIELTGKGKKKEELADFQRLLSNWSF